MWDTATYIKPLSSQHVASVFMRYFTLYGAHGGHTNPIQLPFKSGKGKDMHANNRDLEMFLCQRQEKWQAIEGLWANAPGTPRAERQWGTNLCNIRGLKGGSLCAVSRWPYKTERELYFTIMVRSLPHALIAVTIIATVALALTPWT